MPHFRPWPSHSCRRSPLFSEQDAPVPCPLPPSHSHAIAGPSSRLAAPEKSQTGPAPRTSLLPACWDTGRVSVHAGVLQGPSAKARVHSRGSCTRLQTRLAPQMCPRSPQLGPVPRAAAQPGEAVRSPGAGASGLSGFTAVPTSSRNRPRSVLAGTMATHFAASPSKRLHPAHLLGSPGGARWRWKGRTLTVSLTAVGGSSSPSVSPTRREQRPWVPRVPPRALLVRNCSPGQGQPHPTGVGRGGRRARSLRRTVRNGPRGGAGLLSEPIPAGAAGACGPGPPLPDLPETCPPDRCPALVGPPEVARRLLRPACPCGLGGCGCSDRCLRGARPAGLGSPAGVGHQRRLWAKDSFPPFRPEGRHFSTPGCFVTSWEPHPKASPRSQDPAPHDSHQPQGV